MSAKENPSDYMHVISALSYAWLEGLTMDELYTTITEAGDGEQFEAGVLALIELKDIVDEASSEGPEGFLRRKLR